MPRLLAEITERGGADALDIAAIRRQFEVERKHLVLAQGALDFDRAHDLTKLCRERAFAARLQQTRDLHSERRAAGTNVAAGDELARRAGERQNIDAVMRAEALVLVREQN